MTEAVTTGTKHDSGKPRIGLIDSLFIFGIAKVLTFGARKYAAHNWRGGLEISRIMDAVFRHLFSFMDGEDIDQESGESHLYHAGCGLMFAARMLRDRPDLDDRYKGTPNHDKEYQAYVDSCVDLSTPFVKVTPYPKEEWLKCKPSRDKYLKDKQK